MMMNIDRKRWTLAKWWTRRVVQFLLTLVTGLFLNLSLARLVNMSVVNWPKIVVWIVENYNESIIAIGKLIILTVENFPSWLVDVLTIYLLIGALMRISIKDISLYSEKSYYNDPLDCWDDKVHIEGVQDAKNAGKIESSRFYIFWPVRLFADLRQRMYWRLTPMFMLIYLFIILAILLCLSYC